MSKDLLLQQSPFTDEKPLDECWGDRWRVGPQDAPTRYGPGGGVCLCPTAAPAVPARDRAALPPTAPLKEAGAQDAVEWALETAQRVQRTERHPACTHAATGGGPRHPGAVNPTINPLTRAWRSAPQRDFRGGSGRVPTRMICCYTEMFTGSIKAGSKEIMGPEQGNTTFSSGECGKPKEPLWDFWRAVKS